MTHTQEQALIEAARQLLDAAAGVQRRGKTKADWDRLRGARYTMQAALAATRTDTPPGAAG